MLSEMVIIKDMLEIASMHERPGLLIIYRYLAHETERSFSNVCSIITSGKIQNYQLR